ncbi:MAG: hypothetical protein Q4E46_02075 [Candidatus Saccharibacteria bacterium]|nr:hypothetical protein [Candidatus Saccharibacteria bacterium]
MATKNKKSAEQKEYKRFGMAIITMSIIIFCLSLGLVFCIGKIKTKDEQKYLNFYPEIMRSIAEECEPVRGDGYPTAEENDRGELVIVQPGKISNVECKMDSYGISKDNNPYVSFYYRAVNQTDGTPESEWRHRTMYFSGIKLNYSTGE